MSDTTTINGLHSCKPNNQPTEGEIKTFVVEQRQGKSGKPYLKIKSEKEEYGGRPYKIISAKKTDFVDAHGNLSFNLELEPSSSPPAGWEAQPPPHGDYPQGPPPVPDFGQMPQIRPQNAPQSPPARPNGNPRPSMLDERQRAIVRQHSQSMSLEVLKLKATLNELTVEDLTPAKLRLLADYFDNDVYGATQ